MHLNDQQLLELSQENNQHITECEACRAKAENLVQLRNQLSDLPQVEVMPDCWSEIQKAHNNNQQEKKLSQTRKQLGQWRLASFALAASLAVFVFWSNIESSPSTNSLMTESLVALIEENNELQRLLSNKTKNNYQTHVQYKLQKTDFNLIDQAIQRAYLQGASDLEKYNLWKARKNLMNKLLVETKKTQTIRI